MHRLPERYAPSCAVLPSAHIYCSSVNHSGEDLICARRDLGYPKAIVSEQTKWKIQQCGFLVVCCLGCRDAESAGFSRSSASSLLSFFNQMACSGVEGIKTAAAAAAAWLRFRKACKRIARTLDTRSHRSKSAEAVSVDACTCTCRGINICMSSPICMHTQRRSAHSIKHKCTHKI